MILNRMTRSLLITKHVLVSESDVGGSPGWQVRAVYQKLNSVAVISTREAVRLCGHGDLTGLTNRNK